MYRVAKDMLDLVGDTPLVKINHIVSNKKVKVYAKLERYNPAGSVKDRIAKYMIDVWGERGTPYKGQDCDRTHQWKYRDCSGNGLRCERIPIGIGDARDHEHGEKKDPHRLWSEGRFKRGIERNGWGH